MTAVGHVLVAGASAAGLTTVEALRRKGYTGKLTVLGAEPHLPYDRPPLSKQVLAGTWRPERSALRPPGHLSTLDAEFVLGDPAVSLDVTKRAVHTASGRVLTADAVVLATGLRPRTLPGQDDLTGVHVLRTLDDALALRTDLLTGDRVVVVGDEVTLRLGAAVTGPTGSTPPVTSPAAPRGRGLVAAPGEPRQRHRAGAVRRRLARPAFTVLVPTQRHRRTAGGWWLSAVTFPRGNC